MILVNKMDYDLLHFKFLVNIFQDLMQLNYPHLSPSGVLASES